MVVRRRVIVSGRVQGVFFRDTCAQMAYVNGVGGEVRNRRDGRVEAWFEGDADAVERMVNWCREGPPGAKVEDVEVADEEPHGDTTFRAG